MVKKSSIRLARDYPDLRAAKKASITAEGDVSTMPEMEHVKNPLKLLNPYDKCPCGEGKRFRFCCQKLVPPYIEKQDLPEWVDLFEQAKKGLASW